KNIKELKKIVAPYYLGRRSAEVLKELPPLRFAEHPVQLKPTNGQVSALLKQSFKTIKAALAGCQDEAEVLATLQSQEVALSTQRRIIGVLKAEVIAELVDSELIGGVDKRIIFLNHTDAIDKTASLLKHHRTVVLDGRTPMTERQGLADQ
ncbi:hypothetical protein LJD47_24020, partial [Escherichia coli]|nr:hypothetical protein [Escherichia coli]